MKFIMLTFAVAAITFSNVSWSRGDELVDAVIVWHHKNEKDFIKNLRSNNKEEAAVSIVILSFLWERRDGAMESELSSQMLEASLGNPELMALFFKQKSVILKDWIDGICKWELTNWRDESMEEMNKRKVDLINNMSDAADRLKSDRDRELIEIYEIIVRKITSCEVRIID